MKVSVFRVAGKEIEVEVPEGAVVRDVFAKPETGQVVNREGSLLELRNEIGIDQIRVDGVNATLSTELRPGDHIILVPKVKGA